jgi:asparagine synthetase B (glutamine-hydrolysing)
MMFSGGVDSTLLMTYAADAIQPIAFVPDTPEFQEETRYARTAISLLGDDLREIPTPEADFVRMLEAATDALGTPVFSDSQPYFGELILNQPYGVIVFGQCADSAFGMSLKLSRFSSWFRHPGIRHAVSGIAPRLSGNLGYRMGQVAPKAEGFSRDLFDPEGYAGNSRTFGDTSLFQKTTDRSTVARVKAEQLEYAAKRVDLSADPGSPFFSHIELSHWMVVFGNAIMLPRLMAQSRGRRISAPYCEADVLTELATIPVEERYIRGLTAKWILKDLLDQRLPGYPSNQRKNATGLPYERFYRDGPLTTIWDTYDVPDRFEGEMRDELVASPSTSTWNAITYAVWEQRIARNRDLQPHEAKLAASFTIQTG